MDTEDLTIKRVTDQESNIDSVEIKQEVDELYTTRIEVQDNIDNDQDFIEKRSISCMSRDSSKPVKSKHFLCPMCKFEAFRKNHLVLHIQNVHSGIRHKCDRCDHQATTKCALNKHKKSIHDGVKYPCDQCNYLATEKGNLTAHNKSVHEGTRYSCMQCSFDTTAKSSLSRHKKTIHGDIRHLCGHCDFEADTKFKLTHHKRNVHKKNPEKDSFLIDTKSEKTVKNENSQANEKTEKDLTMDPLQGQVQDDIQENDNKIHFVDQISKSCISSDSSNHAKVKHFICPMCKFEAYRKSHLVLHMQNVHAGIRHKCDRCDHQATTKFALNKHKRSIHDGVRYPCDQCNHIATEKGNLAAHKKSVHLGLKYYCKQCPFQSTAKSSLSRHKKIIHDEIRHPCNQCDFKAVTKFKLTHHKRIVHEKNLFKCSYIGCTYQAKMMGSLVKHEETKHIGKRYPCDYCEYKAMKRSTLKRHMGSIHSNMKPLLKDIKSENVLCNENSLQSQGNKNTEEVKIKEEIDPLQITPEFYTSEEGFESLGESDSKLFEKKPAVKREINEIENFLPIDIKIEKSWSGEL